MGWLAGLALILFCFSISQCRKSESRVECRETSQRQLSEVSCNGCRELGEWEHAIEAYGMALKARCFTDGGYSSSKVHPPSEGESKLQ